MICRIPWSSKPTARSLSWIVPADSGRVFGQLARRNRPLPVPGSVSGAVVWSVSQSVDKLLIERHSTQKLCVRVDSIHAPVGDGDHGGDHLVLAAGRAGPATSGRRRSRRRDTGLGYQTMGGHDFSGASLRRHERASRIPLDTTTFWASMACVSRSSASDIGIVRIQVIKKLLSFVPGFTVKFGGPDNLKENSGVSQ